MVLHRGVVLIAPTHHRTFHWNPTNRDGLSVEEMDEDEKEEADAQAKRVQTIIERTTNEASKSKMRILQEKM